MLTKRQSDLLNYLIQYKDKNGIMPSYREIVADGVSNSLANTHWLMTKLKEKGYVEVLKGRARAIEILKDSSVDERWELIETAPRDGTVILCFESGVIGIVWYCDGWFRSAEQYERLWEPSHWMLLPSHPK